MKLSPTQVSMLRRMVEDAHGRDYVPGGYRTAGRDAARWYATVGVLGRDGLVERAGEQTYRITAKGRVALARFEAARLASEIEAIGLDNDCKAAGLGRELAATVRVILAEGKA